MTNSRAVRKYSTTGEFLQKYESVSAAAKAHDMSTSSLFSHCNKVDRLKPLHGFLWRFEENDNIGNGSLSPSEIMKETGKVRQYTLSGELVGVFPTASEAARQTGIIRSSISECCLRVPNHFTAGGFVWRFSNDDELAAGDVKPRMSGSWIPVRQLTMDGQFVAEYPSMAEASRTFGVNKSEIGKVCRGLLNSWKGFKWEYA